MKTETRAVFITVTLFNSSDVWSICSVTEPFEVLDSCLVVIVVMHNEVPGILDIAVERSAVLEQ